MISSMMFRLLEKYVNIYEVVSDGIFIYFFGLIYIFLMAYLIF